MVSNTDHDEVRQKRPPAPRATGVSRYDRLSKLARLATDSGASNAERRNARRAFRRIAEMSGLLAEDDGPLPEIPLRPAQGARRRVVMSPDAERAQFESLFPPTARRPRPKPERTHVLFDDRTDGIVTCLIVVLSIAGAGTVLMF